MIAGAVRDLVRKPAVAAAPAAPAAVARRRLAWAFLGRVPYGPTAELQEALRRDVRSGLGVEHLLFLEHDPVFTIGRNAPEEELLATPEWLAARGVEVCRTNRGGRVTYHGPGQLVGYPILDLSPDRRDVRRYVRDLQEALIRTLADHGVAARRRDGGDYVGVWVGEEKIASIGVHLARWVTIHGFALNVATDLEHFGGIVACGLPEVRMTSIERLTGSSPPLPDVATCAAHHLGEVFGRRLDGAAAEPLIERLRGFASVAAGR